MVALRLYPVFPQMTRAALNDTALPVGGSPDGNSSIYCPARTLLDTCWYVLHRLPSTWGSDAEVFDPHRWSIFKPKTWEYQPFRGGTRACAG